MLKGRARILLTGSGGFVGRALAKKMLLDEHASLAVLKRNHGDTASCNLDVIHGNLGLPEEIGRLDLQGIDIVIHAGAAVPSRDQKNRISDFRVVNVESTIELAKRARECGVKRFVFLSSIKAASVSDLQSTQGAMGISVDHYAQSKFKAENGLRELARQGSFEIVILRFPIVYGPFVKGNFRLLLEAVKKRVPLPLAGVENSRSYIALDNLTDLIAGCASWPTFDKGVNVFSASDGEDISTTDLIRRISYAYQKTPLLFPFPKFLLKTAGRMTGRIDAVTSLLDDLVVDNSEAMARLTWSPSTSMLEQLAKIRSYEGET